MKTNTNTKQSKKGKSQKIDILSSIEKIPNSRIIIYLSRLILLMSVVLYNKFIFGGFYFLFNDIGYDTITLYWPGYYNITQMIREGLFSTWSFKMGIGSSAFAASQYFTDPFALIFFIIGEDNIAPALVYVVILKHILAGVFTYLFLSQLKISKLAAIIAAILFAFNGYLTLWGQHYLFGSFIVLIPLMLYSFERILEGKGFILFAILTALLSMNLYLFYQFSIYFIFFALYRIFSTNDWNFKKSLPSILSVIGLFILGITLAAFILVPKYYVLTQNPRIGDVAIQFQDKIFSLEGIKYYVQLIFRLFSNDLTGSGHDFFKEFTFLRKESINFSYFNYYEYPQIYAGILSLLILPYTFYKMGRKDKTALIILMVLVFSSLLFPIFSYIFNAFKAIQYRWVFIIPLFLNFTTALALNNILKERGIKKKIVLVPAVVLIILLLLAIILCAETIILAPKNLEIIISNAIPIFILILIYTACIFILRNKTIIFIAIIPIIIFELIYINYPSMNDRTMLSSDIEETKQVYYDGSDKAVDYIKSIDRDFYRLNKERYHFLNDAIIQGFYGVQSYSSLNNPSYIEFMNSVLGLDINRYSKSMIYLIFPKEGNIPYLSSLLGIKYYLTNKPHVYYKGFNKIMEISDVNIFQNIASLPLGFTYDKYISSEEYENLDLFLKKKYLLKCVVLSQNLSDTMGLQKHFPNKDNIRLGLFNEFRFTNCLFCVNDFPRSIKFYANNNSSVTIPIHSDVKTRVLNCLLNFNVLVDKDSKLDIYYKYQGKIVKGLSTKIIKNNPVKNLNLELPASIESLILSFPEYSGFVEISKIKIFENSFEIYKQDIDKLDENSFELTSFKEDYFTGKIGLKKNKLLLFSIPYDEGWKLKVNGVETQLIKAQNGLMGALLLPGEHIIEMSFTPPGLIVGLIISFLALILLILLLIFKRFM